jgi:hypothetical protein
MRSAPRTLSPPRRCSTSWSSTLRIFPDRLLKSLPTAWNLRLLHAFEPTETACIVLTRSHWGASPRGLSIRLRAEKREFAQAGHGRLLKRLTVAATQNWPFLKTSTLDLDVPAR